MIYHIIIINYQYIIQHVYIWINVTICHHKNSANWNEAHMTRSSNPTNSSTDRGMVTIVTTIDYPIPLYPTMKPANCGYIKWIPGENLTTYPTINHSDCSKPQKLEPGKILPN
jgi:hypothetical protein